MNKCKIFDGDNWSDTCSDNTSGVSVTMYDLNKGIVSQLPLITPEQLQKGKSTINTLKGLYFMLLCKDVSYYTIFCDCPDIYNEFTNLGDAVITCIQESLGDIVSIDKMDTGEIEIWWRSGEENCCAYLFNCEQMFVQFGG